MNMKVAVVLTYANDIISKYPQLKNDINELIENAKQEILLGKSANIEWTLVYRYIEEMLKVLD